MDANVDRRRSMESVEEAATELLYYAEHFSLQNQTMHDWKVRRRNLLEAARKYGRAMDALGRRR
jgi:DNA repair ATPase RecN